MEDKRTKGDIQVIRGIATALVKLDLWAVSTDTSARNGGSQRGQAGLDLIAHFSKELRLLDFNNNLYTGTYQQEQKVNHYVQGFSEERAVHQLRDLRACSFHPEMILYLIGASQSWKYTHDLIKKSSDFELPSWAVKGSVSRINYIVEVANNTQRYRSELLALHKTIQAFGKYSMQAASQGLLDDISLEALGERITCIQDAFHDLCEHLGKQSRISHGT